MLEKTTEDVKTLLGSAEQKIDTIAKIAEAKLAENKLLSTAATKKYILIQGILQEHPEILAEHYAEAYAEIVDLEKQAEELALEGLLLRGMIKCKGCGEQIKNESNFCPVCGVKVEKPEPATEEPVEKASEE